MDNDIYHDKIIILDFGSQYTQLIARCLRESGIYCEIHRYDLSEQQLRAMQPAGVILSGGPATVTAVAPPLVPEAVFKLGCPLLGICYGMQAMVKQLGGQVKIAQRHEYGSTRMVIEKDATLFRDIADHIDDANRSLLDVWMSHGDHVTEVPAQFAIVASSDNTPIAAIADEKKQWYGVQFHPEVTHTLQGKRLLNRFAVDICGCKASWQTRSILTSLIEQVKQTVADESVILALSGGVDSSVLAALLHKAIGKQLHCVFVNSGLLRHHEAQQVVNTFKKHFAMDINCVDASEQFLQALAGIADPEQKRKIIGHNFIEVFEKKAKQIKDINWLAQGTIYPDVIESAHGGQAATIKSHHNVAGLPDSMQFKLLEPFRGLFKDEVRKLGLELGLPQEIVQRHPFPGPGLAVRILGEIQQRFIDILRQADKIFIDELYRQDLYYKVSQAFAVFLPVKSVGVVGDNRQYEYVIALRAVETTDFMTAHWARLPHDFLAHVANRIINEVPGVSRVTYDISSKPPATIEWE